MKLPLSLASSFTTLPPVGLSVPVWPWILWNLWKARNKRCFENKSYSAMEIIVKSITDARQWQTAQEQNPISASHHPSTTHRSGSDTPPTDGLICHVDGAWNPSSRLCGTGGVFSGSITLLPLHPISSARKLVSSALMAECLAIRSTIMYAASLNIKSLMILSDSLSLVKLLKSGGSVPALFGILFDIYHFSTLFDVISFSYVSRLGNGEADSVAKSALSLLISSVNGV